MQKSCWFRWFRSFKNTRWFINDDCNIILCYCLRMGLTNRCALGIYLRIYLKKHWGYYQEIGRAGRDGLPSKQLCLKVTETLFQQICITRIKRRVQLAKLERMKYADALSCRRKILSYFGELVTENCRCDICKKSTLIFWRNSSNKASFGYISIAN
jgi:ATP-dependent DNA helicase RecQ